MDMFSIVKNIMHPIISKFWFCFRLLLILFVVAIILFFIIFFIKYRVNPFRITTKKLKSLHIKFKYYDLIRWIIFDLISKPSEDFDQYGFTFFVGRQGAGKTTSMTEYLKRMKKRFPHCLIVTNYGCKLADHVMSDWHDFLDIRNGTNGVIFAIDEIHSEYSAESWKDFPEALLSEISQQRKQRVKIVATAQAFSRCAKPLREQAFSVVVCSTFLKRLVICKEYDAIEYASASTPKALKKNSKPIKKWSYVMGDGLRNLFDTYEKIKRMNKLDFIKRSER